MECREVREFLSAYLDQVLDQATGEEIRVHLERCPSCQEELANIELALNFLQTEDEISPPEDFRSNLRLRLEELNRVEESKTKKSSSKQLPKAWFALGTVAAAILFLFVGLPSLNKNETNIAIQQQELSTLSLPDQSVVDKNVSTKAQPESGRAEDALQKRSSQANDNSEGTASGLEADGKDMLTGQIKGETETFNQAQESQVLREEQNWASSTAKESEINSNSEASKEVKILQSPQEAGAINNSQGEGEDEVFLMPAFLALFALILAGVGYYWFKRRYFNDKR